MNYHELPSIRAFFRKKCFCHRGAEAQRTPSPGKPNNHRFPSFHINSQLFWNFFCHRGACVRPSAFIRFRRDPAVAGQAGLARGCRLAIGDTAGCQPCATVLAYGQHRTGRRSANQHAGEPPALRSKIGDLKFEKRPMKTQKLNQIKPS
jgi:hypothetical protein